MPAAVHTGGLLDMRDPGAGPESPIRPVRGTREEEATRHEEVSPSGDAEASRPGQSLP